MKYSKMTKSNEPHKILRMLAREEEMERNDGKWVATNKVFKNKKKYDRKEKKKDLRCELKSFNFILSCQFVDGVFNDKSYLLFRDGNHVLFVFQFNSFFRPKYHGCVVGREWVCHCTCCHSLDVPFDFHAVVKGYSYVPLF